MQKDGKTWMIATLMLGLMLIIGVSYVFFTSSQEDEIVFNPPSLDDLDPDDPMTEYILYGQKLFSESDTVMPDHVGNKLSCASCHANDGAGLNNSMVGVVPNFPEYNVRAGTIFTIEDRINGCMIRSMNGEMLEENSKEMRSLVAYMTYLSEGIEIGADVPWRVPSMMPEVPEPSIESGEELYAKNCMACHAADGSGIGANTGPALWGDNSFNDGAGMARLSKAAGYIQDNMPPGNPNLTDQEAADLAAFMLSHYRPEFDGHDNDWPNGRPTDIFDRKRVESIQNGTFDWSEIDNIIPRQD